MSAEVPSSAPETVKKAPRLSQARVDLIQSIDDQHPEYALDARAAALSSKCPQVIAHYVERAENHPGHVIEPFPTQVTFEERGEILQQCLRFANFTDEQYAFLEKVTGNLAHGVGSPDDRNPYIVYTVVKKDRDDEGTVYHKIDVNAIDRDIAKLETIRSSATAAQKVLIDNVISSLGGRKGAEKKGPAGGMKGLDPFSVQKQRGIDIVRARKQETLLRGSGKAALFLALTAAGILGLGSTIIHAVRDKKFSLNPYSFGLLLAYAIANPSFFSGKMKNDANEASSVASKDVTKVLDYLRLSGEEEQKLMAVLYEKENQKAVTAFVKKGAEAETADQRKQAKDELLAALHMEKSALAKLPTQSLVTLCRAAQGVRSETAQEIANSYLTNRKRQISIDPTAKAIETEAS